MGYSVRTTLSFLRISHNVELYAYLHRLIIKLISLRGQEEYERLRPLSYSKAHIILIAFSVDTPDSLDNVTQKVSYTISCYPLLSSVGRNRKSHRRGDLGPDTLAVARRISR